MKNLTLIKTLEYRKETKRLQNCLGRELERLFRGIYLFIALNSIHILLLGFSSGLLVTLVAVLIVIELLRILYYNTLLWTRVKDPITIGLFLIAIQKKGWIIKGDDQHASSESYVCLRKGKSLLLLPKCSDSEEFQIILYLETLEEAKSLYSVLQ